MNNKILLIKLGALGDVISFSPIPSLIKQCLPSSRIDHLVYNYASEISQSNSEIVNTISLNPNLSFFRKFFEFIRLVLHLRQQKYHYVFIFHRSFALQFFAFIIRGKFIYGFKSKFNFFLSNHIEYDSNVNTTVLQARLICDSLKLIYSNPPLLNYEFDISKIHAPLKLPAKYICLCLGAGNLHAHGDNKIWPLIYFAEIINSINIPFVIIGKGDLDAKLSNELTKFINNSSKIISIVNVTNLNETAYVLKNSLFYIGNDSSMGYLSCSVGTHSFILYGPTQISAFLPFSNFAHGIESPVICSPCYDPFLAHRSVMYTCTNNLCMKSITPKMVIDRINTVLRIDINRDFPIGIDA